MIIVNIFFSKKKKKCIIYVVQNDCTPTYGYAPSIIEGLADIQNRPDVSISPIMDSIVIVYEDQTIDGDGYGIGCTMMYSNWNIQKTSFVINTETALDQLYPRVLHFPNGKFLVTWMSANDNEIHGRVMLSDGQPSTDEFPISENNGDCSYSEIAMYDDGTAIVVWNVDGNILRGRFVESDGTVVGSELTLRTSNVNIDQRPSVDVSDDQNSFIVFNNFGLAAYGAKFSKSDGSLIRDYGEVLETVGNYPGVVCVPDDNAIIIHSESSDRSKHRTSLFDLSVIQNTMQHESDTKTTLPSLAKARDSVIIATYTFSNSYYISNYLIDQFNNLFIEDWVIFSTVDCNYPSVNAYDTGYSVVWTNSNDIYGVKYNLKYPNYMSGLDDLSAKIGESFTFDFVFNDPELVGLTYEVKQANGSDLPIWMTHSTSSSTQITGTTPTELSECSTQTFEFTVTTSKSCLMTETKNFQIQVTDDPIVAGTANFQDQTVQIFQADWSYPFDVDCFSDLESQEIIYSSKLSNGDPLPEWLEFEPTTRTFSSPQVADQCNATLQVAVNASDHCNSLTRDFGITIVNEPVTCNHLLLDQNDRPVNSWFEYQFDSNSFADPENVELTYSATLSDGSEKPDWLTIHSNNQTLNGVIGRQYCDGENLEIKLTASDGCNSISDLFNMTFTNQPVSAGEPLTSQTKPVNTYFEYPFSSSCFNDPENVELSYSATLSDNSEKPTWLELESSTRTFSGTIPADSDCGKFWDIKVTASDECSNVASNFRITSTNSAPTVNKNLDDQSFYVNNLFEFQFEEDCFNDPENAELTYSATLNDGSDLPTWLDFYSSNQTFRGKVLPGNCGEAFEIKVTASDHCADVSSNFQLTIENPAPFLNKEMPIQKATITVDFEYTFDSETFLNDDGTELTYTAYRKGSPDLPSWLEFYSNNRTFHGKPENDLCNYKYEIIVDADDGCNDASGSFNLEVRNRVPIREKDFTDHSINVFEVIDYTLPEGSFSDPDGQDITLEAHLAETDSREWPSWLEFNKKTGNFYGNASSCGDPYVIVVAASDPCLDSITGNWTLTIFDEPPEIKKPFQDQTFYVNAYNSYQFDNDTFADPNGYALTYEATKVNGDPLPDWLEFDSENRKFTGIASGCTQTLTVKVTAIDKCTSTASQNFQISLVNNPIYEDKGLEDQEYLGNLLFNYTFDINAFGDLDKENKNYNYDTECLEPDDEWPTWLSFQPKSRRFLGNTPNEDVQYTIQVHATDSCGSIKASSSFKIQINKAETKTDNTDNTLSTGILSVLVIFPALTVICLILILVYRYNLQKKYQRLWDGKAEFFTAKIPEQDIYNQSSKDNSDDTSDDDVEKETTEDEALISDGHPMTVILNGNALSNIEVSDLTNDSDIENTYSSNTSSSNSSPSSTSNFED
ncbi:dystroglycan-related [Anaeramoeba flamelloides]|uniref:Dystroglycan-related n=1 Tax=Anaeramoeba flamelloides TaxID=1746091 RepID=A0ABQ8YIT8_9EUKA|nr:dystroglycan-related [Anaeramoeba flamelloides]